MTATAPPRDSTGEDAGPEPRRTSRRQSRRRARTRSQAPARPKAPKSLRNAPFAGLVLILLGGGLVTLLLINNSLAAGSFEQAQLRADKTLLFEQEQALNQEVLALSSPTRLRAAAKALGMLPAASSAYIDPLTGEILGVPRAAVGDPTAQDSTPSAGTPGSSESWNTPASPGTTDSSSSSTPSSSVTSDTSVPSSPSGTGSESGGADASSDTSGTDGSSPAGSGDTGTGDGASVSSGTAYDRAIVSGADITGGEG